MPPSASASPPTQTTHWVPKRISRLARPAPDSGGCGGGGGGGSNEGGGGSDGGGGGSGGKPASAAPGKTIGGDAAVVSWLNTGLGSGVGSGGGGTGSAAVGGSGARTGERMISGRTSVGREAISGAAGAGPSGCDWI